MVALIRPIAIARDKWRPTVAASQAAHDNISALATELAALPPQAGQIRPTAWADPVESDREPGTLLYVHFTATPSNISGGWHPREGLPPGVRWTLGLGTATMPNTYGESPENIELGERCLKAWRHMDDMMRAEAAARLMIEAELTAFRKAMGI